MTPMMQQYFEIKDNYKDFILMYRLGDFYEMFFEDAQIASKELDLTLTGRDCGEKRACAYVRRALSFLRGIYCKAYCKGA